MRYRVDVSREAWHDIDTIYEYYLENAPGAADPWLTGLTRALFTLRELPHRCPVAREVEGTGSVVRYLLYRGYRIQYAVTGSRVIVMHVVHSSLFAPSRLQSRPPPSDVG